MAVNTNTVVTNFPTPVTSTCNALLGDSSGYAVMAACTGTPPTTAGWFQHGCLITQTDSGGGNAATYENTGTVALPVWTILSTSASNVNNYIATETGSNNALVGSLPGVTVAAGLQVQILLAHTLQAGSNTFNLNSHGTDAIKKQSDPGANLTSGFLVGAIASMVFDGTVWQMIGYSG